MKTARKTRWEKIIWVAPLLPLLIVCGARVVNPAQQVRERAERDATNNMAHGDAKFRAIGLIRIGFIVPGIEEKPTYTIALEDNTILYNHQRPALLFRAYDAYQEAYARAYNLKVLQMRPIPATNF